ncbi:hypothetical protein [Ruminococcus sp. FC2018]|uniref:InlB B-repeat-containing protein n=1 Tax=Ruminococcus sp. FC2018 TaxID=1410617 RepID=UPI000490F019|nr:hypothetical protein [Ruminococcus sp. FC2018]
MKGKIVKRLAAFAVALAMIGSSLPAELGGIGLFDGFSLTASAAQEAVSYTVYSWNNSTKTLSETTKTITDYKVVTKDIIKNSEDGNGILSGTYVVTQNTTVEDYLYIRKGCTANIVVPKGVTLTCKQGIGCGYDKNKAYATLNIYGGGKIVANGMKYAAGIGGKDDETNGNITIHGTEIEATGGHHGAGIGGGEGGQDPDASSPTITIYAGKITANGGMDGAGIGGGDEQPGARTYIYGGDITASSEKHGAGIGGGDEEGTFGIHIYDGKITATGGEGGAGIGAGEEGGNLRKKDDGGGINIYGGEITAKGGGISEIDNVHAGAGIGGGWDEDMSGTIFISGDTTKLTAQGGIGAAGIGAGRGEWPFPNGDMKGEITIECGDNSDLKIIGGSGGAGIGAGFQGNMQGKAYINGGKIKITSGYEAAGIGGGREGTFDEGGEGGTVYIGGGDITIDLLSNDPQLADSHAIGRGALDEKTGTLYISKDNNKTGKCMRVDYRLFREKEGWSGTAKAGSRTDKCHAENDVHITECNHKDVNGKSGLSYSINKKNNTHTVKCKYCGLNKTEAHKGSDCECGYMSGTCTVTLVESGNSYADVARNQEFELPDYENRALFGNVIPTSFYRVTGWKLSGDTSGKVYEQGENVKITNDMTFTSVKEDLYQIKFDTLVNGSFRADLTDDAAYAAAGEVFEFGVDADPGYSVSKVTYKIMDGVDTNNNYVYSAPIEIGPDNGKYQLTLPSFTETSDIKNNMIVISAEITKNSESTIYISRSTGGTVSADKETAKDGDTVTLTVTPGSGYALDKIRVVKAKNKDTLELTKVSETKYTFTMPSESVVVSAEFEEDEDAQSYISSASVSVDGEIGVNLYIKPGNNIGSGYVKVKGPNDTDAKKVELTDEIFDTAEKAYKVSCPVYAPQMGEKVEFTLFDENNVQHELWNSAKTSSYEVYRYAVNDYIETAKNSDKASDKLKTLAGKMQNYGAWSRDYLIASKQISSDTAAICDTTEVTGVNASTFESKQIEKSSGFAVEGLSVSLSLDSKTALRIYYKGDKIDDITAFCGDESVTLKTGTARDMNYVEIDNIPAHHLRDNYEFTFGDKGNATVSAYSYCYLVLANSTNEKLKSTVKAMYEYSETAKIYFNQ